MFIRFVVVAMLAVSLLPTAGSAQTAAELLQKGIYTQQTAGNLDGAIQIYRQVIAMPGVDRSIAARAQMQLVSAFLQKGDLPGASREFNTLARNYRDQKETVSAMTAAMRAAGSTASTQDPPPTARRTTSRKRLTKGTLENGVYHNTTTGTEIRLPAGWSIIGDGEFPGGCEYVVVKDSSSQSYYVWMKSSSPTAIASDGNFQLPIGKVDGVQGLEKRSMILRFDGGALNSCSAASDFDQNGAPIEYDTSVRTKKTSVYFRSICPASSAAMVQASIRILVHATVLP